jgi:ribosomal subunit interface protein
MQVVVKARHMTLTRSLKGYVHEKLCEALMRVFDRPAAKIEVELSHLGHLPSKLNKECRITLFVPKSKTIVISEIDDNMYKAINLAHDRLLVQVKKVRGRRRLASQRRKWCERDRAHTARQNLTRETEAWERELMEYEGYTRATHVHI